MTELQLESKISRAKEDVGFITLNCFDVSVYADELLTAQQAVIEATKMCRLFNIDKLKADYIAEIMVEDGWTKKRCDDAIKFNLKHNIYATKNIGLEPAKILAYDKSIRLYTQEQVLTINHGNGTTGYKLVKAPVKRTVNGMITNLWYIAEWEDAPDWWDN